MSDALSPSGGALLLPTRYELLRRLGHGGGGEVWAVRDRYGDREWALKVLAAGYGSAELDALIREAVALSGLEGLGLPRVSAFGRLADGRPYLVRELVDGTSLDQVWESASGAQIVAWLARAAEMLTHLHRAGLLHGDIKPANIIVRPDDSVTLVDLGLAAAWQERGAIPEGLTPHFAAPEVAAGRSLTARSEIYSLGVMLRDVLLRRPEAFGEHRAALDLVVKHATESEPARRYPSADEFASALRHAAGIPAASPSSAEEHWPVESIDRAAADLLAAIHELQPGGVLRVQGPEGSGRTSLLRRAAWTLAMRGADIVWFDEDLCAVPHAMSRELDDARPGQLLLIDPPKTGNPLTQDVIEALRKRVQGGARLVVIGDLDLGVPARLFDVPPLDFVAVQRLLRRAMPSLTEAMAHRVLEATGGRPGALRRLVARAASSVIASAGDLEQLIARDESLPSVPEEPREAARFYLDRGRFTLARAALDRITSEDADRVWLEVRWELGAGSPSRALTLIEGAQLDEQTTPELRAAIRACHGRALLGVGRYADALQILSDAESFPRRPRIEALAYRGLAESLLEQGQRALATLEQAMAEAEQEGVPRLEALVASSYATALWRGERMVDAATVYRRAIRAAEEAGDAGILSNAQINLASLLKVQGDLAASLEMLEAAVDTARRSGRRATLHQALLNLANADLYLGRWERARSSIAAIDREALTAVARAQCAGLQAELAERAGQLEQALELYGECETSWLALGRKRDAAEVILESSIVRLRSGHFEPTALQQRLTQAQELLGEERRLQPLLRLAEARLLLALGDEAGAEARCRQALSAAEEANQKEWLWRCLELEAELLERTGRKQRSHRVRARALEVVEDIGASLPRDLREVYWNDPRRRSLRQELLKQPEVPREPIQVGGGALLSTAHSPGVAAVSRLTQTPLEQRLTRILAVNHDLAGEFDLGRLCQKIVNHAADLLRSDRAFILLVGEDGELTVQADQGLGAEMQRDFSRSIAERVVRSGEPFVSVDVTHDGRLAGAASVHQRMVSAVACVPVLDPRGHAIGALHLETRGTPSPTFADELPTLRAFADQVAIALENARLLAEVQARSDELEESNRQLAATQQRLQEVLEARTARLKEVRRELRTTRKSLEAHYTYEGIVGTSAAMRRIYAMIDRIKDTDVPVLITGESGTGKEVVARAIHQSSPRAKASFLGVNCGAIPEQILESELFGHVRGAFTGADWERKGLFREAEGGSLLLDEIGETPPKMQAGLLRVLQERRVRPVGGQAEVPVNVRVIFATNRDLEAMVKAGQFREDLLYRIRVVELRLPPLRERVDDIPQLVDHFFARFAMRFDRPKKSLSREALHALLDYSWPGNVRQFENVLLNAWILSEGDVIQVEDLEVPRMSAHDQESPREARPSAPTQSTTRQTASQHRRNEKDRIIEALNACNWNRVKAAELIGMPRRTFYRRLQQYGIQ